MGLCRLCHASFPSEEQAALLQSFIVSEDSSSESTKGPEGHSFHALAWMGWDVGMWGGWDEDLGMCRIHHILVLN